MKRTLYFSTADADLAAGDIDDIVATSQSRNEKNDVTGALAYNGRNFCQLLEGPADVIEALLAKISKDPRHSGFKVLDERNVETRAFPDWSMKRVEDLNFQLVIDAMKA